MNQITRRDSLKLAALLGAFSSFLPRSALSQIRDNPVDVDNNSWAVGGASNFHAVYGNAALRDAFFLFLKNVYHLFPEGEFHELITSAVREGKSDREIYERAQQRLDSIRPFLADMRYAMPALSHQKREMARETLALLGEKPHINGFMEIGSTGRYISELRSSIELRGDLFLVNAAPPTYSAIDIVERGRIGKLGRYVPLNNYEPIPPTAVMDSSLDVVANYIGFHHSPLDKRDGFVRSVQRVLRPGGRLILRDHDVHSEDQNRIVALAHDVFNMGLGTPWSANQTEIRNFTSLDDMIRYLDGLGLRYTSARQAIFQAGDPTKNALIEFVKT